MPASLARAAAEIWARGGKHGSTRTRISLRRPTENPNPSSRWPPSGACALRPRTRVRSPPSKGFRMPRACSGLLSEVDTSISNLQGSKCGHRERAGPAL